MFLTFVKLTLSASILVATLAANASPLQCRQLFTNPATGQAARQEESQTARAPRTPVAVENVAAKAAGFDLSLFEVERTRILTTNKVPQKLRTTEARAAVIAAAMKKSGNDAVKLEEWVQTASRAEIKALRKTIGKWDPKKGLSPKRAYDMYLKILEITQHNRTTWRGLITKGWSAQEKQTLMAWARAEYGQKPFVESLDKMEQLREPGVRDVLARWRRDHPNAAAVLRLNYIALNTFFVQLAGVPLTLPQLSMLRRTALSSSMKGRITRNEGGFDQLYPALKARYGQRARFDAAWRYARHIFTGGVLAYALIVSYPEFFEAVMPEGYLDENDSMLEAGAKVLDYYTRLGMLVRFDRLTGKPLDAPVDQQVQGPPPPAPLPDAVGPDANATAATDTALNAEEPTNPDASASYTPPSFDPAPDMPADIPAEALPPSSSADSSPSSEPSAETVEF